MIRFLSLLIYLVANTTSIRADVKISEAEYEGRAHFVIRTATAEYWYDRAGGGFSRLIDVDKRDWISFRASPLKEVPASAAAGFRGLPNLVFGKDNPDAGVGHPGFDKCTTELLNTQTLLTRSLSGTWEWYWSFSDDHATLTILRNDPDHPYWFLYEGTIGGRWSPSTHFFGTDRSGPSKNSSDSKSQSTLSSRFVYFGDDSSDHVILLVQNEPDELVENLWYMGATPDGLDAPDGMVVFGFGREKGSKPLLRKPLSFRVGFVETAQAIGRDQLHNLVTVAAISWLDSRDWDYAASRISSTSQPFIDADKTTSPSAASSTSSVVSVSDDKLFGDMECFRIQTPTATYMYGKNGAGFSAILDPAGNDWIGYKHGGWSQGEYRGLPKSGQPTKYFHCGYGFGQYATENLFRTSIEKESEELVRLRSISKDGKSECYWDFFPTHATMTLLKIDAPAYWFLYEGTPGGRLDPVEDFVIRPGNRRSSLNEPWLDEVPWVYFDAQESNYSFFLIDHQNETQPESYVSWPYKRDTKNHFQEMTIFGFGRPAWDDPRQHSPTLTTLPGRFTIGFTDATEYSAIERKVEALRTKMLE